MVFSQHRDPNLLPENVKNGVVVYKTVGNYDPPYRLEIAGHDRPALVSDNGRGSNGSSSGSMQINDSYFDTNKKVVRVSTNGNINESSVPRYFDHVSYCEIDLTTGVFAILGTNTAQANNQGDGGGIALNDHESFVAMFDGELCHAFTRGNGHPNTSANRFYFKRSTQELVQFNGYYVDNYAPVKKYSTQFSGDVFDLSLRHGASIESYAPEVQGEATSFITATSILYRG